MTDITKFIDAGDKLRDADEETYNNAGGVLINFLRQVEEGGGTPQAKLAKLQPLLDFVNGSSVSTFAGPNAEQVKHVIEAAIRCLGVDDLSKAEATLRQGFAVRMLTGDITINGGGALQVEVDAQQAINAAQVAQREAEAKKTDADSKLQAAEQRIAQLEAILRRAKGSVDNRGRIVDNAVIAEIKGIV